MEKTKLRMIKKIEENADYTTEEKRLMKKAFIEGFDVAVTLMSPKVGK